MLSRRLGLEPPLLSRVTEPQPSEPMKTMELIMGAESLRLATLRRTNTVGYAANETADLPLPAEIRWQPLAPPAAEEQVDIEPIAMHVPEDCFYIRFGSFQNYLWFDKLQQEYGGDLERMITLRGFDDQAGDRMQRQLALETSPLADLLGPAVIADVALIGRDLFLREGAAVGMLFQARNALLGNDLNNQRKAALDAEKANGASLETMQIGGRDVSFLSTPDYRLRSYYVVDGDYHLVTTSRAIVERFLAVRDGRGSLGASSEFRHARIDHAHQPAGYGVCVLLLRVPTRAAQSAVPSRTAPAAAGRDRFGIGPAGAMGGADRGPAGPDDGRSGPRPASASRLWPAAGRQRPDGGGRTAGRFAARSCGAALRRFLTCRCDR